MTMFMRIMVMNNFTIYIKSNNESISFFTHASSKLIDISGNYSYYFVLETYESEVLTPYESSDTTYSYGDYRKQIDYTNSRLFLNEDNSVEIKMNEKTIFYI